MAPGRRKAHRRVMEPSLAEPTRAPWRTTATLALTTLLVVAVVGLTVRYRHDHRDEWVHREVAWWGFDVSLDGRTLTFHGGGVGPCTEPTGVSFSSDPTQGGQVLATLQTRTQVVRDGRPLLCEAVMSIDGPVESITLDRPVPDGTIITDGRSPDASGPSSCRARTQVVRAPTSIGFAPGCTAEG